jgi:hypothetical protein
VGGVFFAFLSVRTLLLVLGGAAAGLIVLYLLRLRRRRVAVPFLPLWAEATSDAQSSALLRRLRRLWSLLLALAFAALLATAAADPRPAAHGEAARTVVLLVDASASMQATDVPPAASRLGRAVERALAYVDGLRPADAAMVVRADGQVAPVTSFTPDKDLLREALRGLAATDTRADFRGALALAGDALAGLPRPTVAVFSDMAVRGEAALGLPDLAARGVATELFPVGSSGRNVGITAFSVRRYLANRTAFEVYGTVQNFHAAPLRVAVRLYLDGAQVSERLMDLGPRAAAPLVEADLTVGDVAHEGRLEARVALAAGGADDLPADDVAYAVVPPHRRVKALIVGRAGRENLFLEAALVGGEAVDYERAACESFDATRLARYDVAVFDGCFPPAIAAAGSGRFLLLDVGGATPVGTAGTAATPASATEAVPWRVGPPVAFPPLAPARRDHPLLRWVTLADVGVAEVRPLLPVPGRGDQVVVTAGGDKAAIVARSDGAVRAVGFGFDVRRSDLPLRIAFPMLVLNTIDWLTFSGDDAYRASLRAGTVFSIPLEGAAEGAPGVVLDGAASRAPARARVTFPSGATHEVPLHDGRAVFYGAERGFYTVSGGAAAPLLLAANLADPEESDILPAPAFPTPTPLSVPTVSAAAATTSSGSTTRTGLPFGDDWWRLLLVAALVLTLAEWLTYNRRLTV